MTHNLEPKLYFGDLFGKLKPEEKVEIIKPKVKRNETLDLIIEEYKEGLENYGLYNEKKLKIEIPEGEYWRYYIAKSSAPLEIPSERIIEFSLLLGEYENKKYFEDFTGFYLSALINKSNGKDFKIITNYLTKTIHEIGYENTKNIDVNGNVGDFVGWRMKHGKIAVKGNAGSWVGGVMEDGEITINGNAGKLVGWYMKGGKITVNGNAGDKVGYGMRDGEITVNGNAGWVVGWDMKDGEITVNGNAGDGVGDGMKNGKIIINGNAGWGVGRYMKDGEIHLNGDYESLGYIYGGNIYHKGELIVENGRGLI